jgi:serine/threonine-protein kinase
MSDSRTAVVLAGRYRLEDWIASGGMGEVWRASDLLLHRWVAVKLLRPEYAGHPETVARFRAEARHAGSLSHPGIAQIYDYGEAGPANPPFLVMELVDGPPLARLLAAGPLHPARVMDIVAQAALGLDAAHAAGLVHRDVKPGNLLLAPGDRVKITDFGIAHAAGSAPVTITGMVVGTPSYLAPERVAGAAAAPASDLYSLGVVAYECLAGAPPFAGTAMEVALAHRMRPLPELPPAVPAEAAALVARLTEKDPAARPGTAREAADWARHVRDALAARAAAPHAALPHAALPHVALPAAPADAPASWDAAPGVPAGASWRAPASWDAVRGTGADASRPAPASWDAAWGAGAADRSPTLAGVQAPTLAGLPVLPDHSGPEGRQGGPRHWSWRGRAAALAAAAAVVAVLAGWALAGLATGHRPGSPPAQGSAASRHSPAARLVTVNGQALAGQPAWAVAERLRQLGLRVDVQHVRTGQQDPGTVISVQPAGQVRAGSLVTLTAALPPGRGDGRGGGGHHHGDGAGNGQGGD